MMTLDELYSPMPSLSDLKIYQNNPKKDKKKRLTPPPPAPHFLLEKKKENKKKKRKKTTKKKTAFTLVSPGFQLFSPNSGSQSSTSGVNTQQWNMFDSGNFTNSPQRQPRAIKGESPVQLQSRWELKKRKKKEKKGIFLYIYFYFF